MGCCNKKLDERPIGRLRYWGGATIITSVHLGGLLAVSAIALAFPRYRRIVPFYREYTSDVIDGILRRDRIRLEHEAGCAVGNGTRETNVCATPAGTRR